MSWRTGGLLSTPLVLLSDGSWILSEATGAALEAHPNHRDWPLAQATTLVANRARAPSLLWFENSDGAVNPHLPSDRPHDRFQSVQLGRDRADSENQLGRIRPGDEVAGLASSRQCDTGAVLVRDDDLGPTWPEFRRGNQPDGRTDPCLRTGRARAKDEWKVVKSLCDFARCNNFLAVSRLFGHPVRLWEGRRGSHAVNV